MKGERTLNLANAYVMNFEATGLKRLVERYDEALRLGQPEVAHSFLNAIVAEKQRLSPKGRVDEEEERLKKLDGRT